MSDLISVIVPVYNVEPYLERCLKSIINQTYKNLEILVIDDGSTDNSGLICDKFKNDGRVTVIHKHNEGLSVARNIGLDSAHGQWISFVDSDDYLAPQMVDFLYALAKKYKADVSTCGVEKFSWIEKKTLNNSERTDCIELLHRKDIIKSLTVPDGIRFEVWNKLWNRNLIGETRFVPGQVSEDVHFDRFIFSKDLTMIYTSRKLYYYTVMRPGSTGTSFKMNRLMALDEFKEWIKSEKNTEVKSNIAYISAEFAIDLYEEGYESKIDAIDLSDIHNRYLEFDPYIDYSSIKFKFYLKFKLFKHSPNIFMNIRNVIKYIRRRKNI